MNGFQSKNPNHYRKQRSTQEYRAIALTAALRNLSNGPGTDDGNVTNGFNAERWIANQFYIYVYHEDMHELRVFRTDVYPKIEIGVWRLKRRAAAQCICPFKRGKLISYALNNKN